MNLVSPFTSFIASAVEWFQKNALLVDFKTRKSSNLNLTAA